MLFLRGKNSFINLKISPKFPISQYGRNFNGKQMAHSVSIATPGVCCCCLFFFASNIYKADGGTQNFIDCLVNDFCPPCIYLPKRNKRAGWNFAKWWFGLWISFPPTSIHFILLFYLKDVVKGRILLRFNIWGYLVFHVKKKNQIPTSHFSNFRKTEDLNSFFF